MVSWASRQNPVDQGLLRLEAGLVDRGMTASPRAAYPDNFRIFLLIYQYIKGQIRRSAIFTPPFQPRKHPARMPLSARE
jgi:hypothetical protein